VVEIPLTVRVGVAGGLFAPDVVLKVRVGRYPVNAPPQS
jgi:hypothetical protein